MFPRHYLFLLPIVLATFRAMASENGHWAVERKSIHRRQKLEFAASRILDWFYVNSKPGVVVTGWIGGLQRIMMPQPHKQELTNHYVLHFSFASDPDRRCPTASARSPTPILRSAPSTVHEPRQ